jgi:hypothetical protein
VTACLGALILLAACGQTAATNSAGQRTGSRGLVSVPTSCWPQCHGHVVFATLVTGILAGSPTTGGGCLWLKPILGAARRVPVVWPAGFHARLSPVELFNVQGRVIARAGDRLQFGGFQASVRASRPCMLGQRYAALVQGSIFVHRS